MSSMSVIYITSIVSLSLMGLGYGMWNDDLNLNVSTTTGKLNARFNPSSSYIDGLYLSVSNEGKILEITGEVYPGFNQETSVEIINNGTIPFIFDDKEIEVGGSISYPISISIPGNDIVIPMDVNATMIEYDESAIIAQRIQEIDDLITRLDVTEYYIDTEELEIEQGLGN